MVAWWTPACRRQMFYESPAQDVTAFNGRIFPQPPLVWRVENGDLKVRALAENKRPKSEFFPAAAALVFRLEVSPDFKKIIAAQPVPDIPASWSAYQSASSTLHFERPPAGADRSGKDYSWPWEYSYIDLETRASHPLVAAPSDYTTAFGIEAAIDQLNKDGLIDPSQGGIIGFSRTHWYVEQALIHDPQRYKAATLIDGVDQSYPTGMLFGASNRLSGREHEAANGTKLFGPGLRQWLNTAAGFNLDKVRATITIEAIGPPSDLGEWETYSSLFQQGKAVDFLEIPNGQHILQKPLARFVSQQGNVD
jgi:hypothetical protein